MIAPSYVVLVPIEFHLGFFFRPFLLCICSEFSFNVFEVHPSFMPSLSSIFLTQTFNTEPRKYARRIPFNA